MPTLTLDPDVAALTERLRRTRGQSLKSIVNEALRHGLRAMATVPSAGAAPYRTPAVDLGRCRVGSLDDVAEAVAVAEGEGFRYSVTEYGIRFSPVEFLTGWSGLS